MIPKYCPECGGEIFFDRKTGEHICKSCGLVVAETVKGVVTLKPPPRYVPKPPTETLYHMKPDVKKKLLGKLHWWEK